MERNYMNNGGGMRRNPYGNDDGMIVTGNEYGPIGGQPNYN